MDRTGEILPENIISMLRNVLTKEDAAKFDDGLSKHVHRLSLDPSPAHTQALLQFVRQWSTRVVLEQNTSWRDQVEDSEHRIASGDLGDPVDHSTLRELLGR